MMAPLTLSENCPAPKPLGEAAGWTLGMISHGVPFRLSAKTKMLLELMRQQAPFGSLECPDLQAQACAFALENSESSARYVVTMDGEILTADEPLRSALIELGGQLMIHVAEYAPDYVFLHAGVVAWNDRALLLPGVSHAGKSTLVAELVRGGAIYYSDEFALLDSQGYVHPFSRDLRMRHPGRVEQSSISLAQLKGRAGTGALPVSLVVFTEFAEHGEWSPKAITAGRAMLEMLLHATPVQREPSRVLATLAAVMHHATAWRSQRGEATSVVSSLLAALASGEAPA